ncbi:MAG: Pyridine nucleotide-disulfide oxidoreductase, partial [Porphyrobacter sp. HL-46]
TPMRREPV